MLDARTLLTWLALPTFILGCDGCNYGLQQTPTPPVSASAAQMALAGAKVMIGTGDIASCGDIGDESTAKLVDSVLKLNAAANVETVVFTLGDHAYPMASERQMRRCYTPSWGDPRKGIMRAVRPAIGNHDYQADRGAPYYRYFGSRAGEPGKGYYSYALGDWHVIVLNSELAVDGDRSEIATQEAWLKKDLADSGKRCTIAYFHRPLFSSAYRRGVPEMRNLFTILYERDVDLILNGHDHHYERFKPQNPAGAVDSVRGIEQIIVGTGGATLRGFKSRFGLRSPPLARNTAVQIQGHYGVLEVVLGDGEYRSAFRDVDGRIWDPHGRKCH